MKKIICLVIALSMLVCALASCANTETTGTTAEPIKVTASEYSVTEYFDGLMNGGGIPQFHQGVPPAGLVKESYKDLEKAGTTKEIKIDGETYKLDYKTSVESEYYNYGALHYYVNKGIKIGFTDSGDCVYASGLIRNNCEKISQDEALKKAEDFLKGKVTNISEYELQEVTDKYDESYRFDFARFIDGMITNETMRVIINFDGSLGGYVFNNIGAFDGVDVSGIDMNEIEEVLKEKLDKTYEGYTYEITYKKYTMCRKADGKFAFDVALEFNVSGKEFTTPVPDEMFLLITLE
jgi:hypothetical protein